MNDYISRLVKQFESGTKGSLALSSCGNDWGLSCGSYQLTLRWGNCISFLKKYFPTATKALYFNAGKPDSAQKAWPGADYCSSPDEVKRVWTACYNDAGKDKFFECEHEYIRDSYYEPLMKKLAGYYNPNNSCRAVQECMWSWAVHRGISGAYNEFKAAMDAEGIHAPESIKAGELLEICYDKRHAVSGTTRYSTAGGESSERLVLRKYTGTAPLKYNGSNPTKAIKDETAKKKASELVQFAEKALKEGWGYVWGGSGEEYTNDVAEKLYSKYKTSKYDKAYYLTTQIERWEGRRVCDCSGLLRAFGASGTADDMYKKSTSNGRLDTCSLIPGTLIFCQGTDGKMNHVGVMVAGGYVIHSTNSKDGVIKEKRSASARGWTHWGLANFIDYDNAVVAALQLATVSGKPTLRKGSSGSVVKELQSLLNQKIKAELLEDGKFGDKTHAAVTLYQTENDLKVDGIVGEKTWGVLLK